MDEEPGRHSCSAEIDEICGRVFVRASGSCPGKASSFVAVCFHRFHSEFVRNEMALQLRTGDMVITQGESGTQLGMVVDASPEFAGHGGRHTSVVVRLANGADIARGEAVTAQLVQYLGGCQSMARAVGLDIEIVDIEQQFDDQRLTVYFRSEQMVDFRTLVRELDRWMRKRLESAGRYNGIFRVWMIWIDAEDRPIRHVFCRGRPVVRPQGRGW